MVVHVVVVVVWRRNLRGLKSGSESLLEGLTDGLKGALARDEGFAARAGDGFIGVLGFDVGFQVRERATDWAGEAGVVEGEEGADALVVELKERKGKGRVRRTKRRIEGRRDRRRTT